MSESAKSEAADELEAWRAWDAWRLYGGNRRLVFGLKQRIYLALASIGFRAYARIMSDSLKWEVEDPHGVESALRRQTGNYIFPVWHNRLIGTISYFERFHIRVQQAMRMAPLVSESFDGELIARSIRDCNGENVRGSSSHNAVAGLKQAVEGLRTGLSLFVTGDGPKGPRYRLKPGCIMAAKLSGRPLVPVVWSASRAVQMRKAWDQLLIPLRGARMKLVLGEPMHVAEDASPREIALARRELEARMQQLVARADADTNVTWQIPAPRDNERAKLRKVMPVADVRRL